MSKAQPLPAILLANDLLEGEVVFLTKNGDWSKNPVDAWVAYDAETAATLEFEGKKSSKKQKVIEAYLVDVVVSDDGVPVPNHFRERFKIKGPSNRKDLGKQAEFAVS